MNAIVRISSILAMAVAVMLAPTPVQKIPFKLSATALIMGGTNQVWSVPPSTPEKIRDAVVSANEAYIAPTGLCTGGTPGCDLVAVYTPEQLRPFTGLTAMTFDKSVEQGRINLDDCLRGLTCTATRSPYTDTRQEQFVDSSFVVNGLSQSAVLSSYEKSYLIAHPLSDRSVSFVLTSNESRPNGGLIERFVGLYVPYLGITFNGATPTDSAKSNPLITVDSAKQYDGWVDFPLNPLNVLASVNALIGALLLHGDYHDVKLNAQLQGQYQDSTYYLLPTPILPLLMPLSGIPLIGMPLALGLDAPLRVLVEAGYDRTINPGQPTPAQYLHLADPIATTKNFLEAVPTGWDDAISYIRGDPSARPFGTAPQPVYGVGGPSVYAGAIDPYGPPVAMTVQSNAVPVASAATVKATQSSRTRTATSRSAEPVAAQRDSAFPAATTVGPPDSGRAGRAKSVDVPGPEHRSSPTAAARR